MADKKLLNNRALSESVFDILKHICNIEHTQYRSPDYALTHLIAGLGVYVFIDHNPSIFRKNTFRNFTPTIHG